MFDKTTMRVEMKILFESHHQLTFDDHDDGRLGVIRDNDDNILIGDEDDNDKRDRG